MNKTIQVVNESTMKFKPDQTIIKLTISDMYDTYEEALRMSQEETRRIKNMLVKLGLIREEMKTSYFNVNPEYDYKKTKDGLERKIIIGYKYTHAITVKFGIDNQLLATILFTLTEGKATIHIDLSYSIKDEDELEKQVLDKCIKEAKEKAKLIATSSEVELGDIVNIQYSKDERELYNHVYRGRMVDDYCSNGGTMDINPHDIKISQGIIIDWEIK